MIIIKHFPLDSVKFELMVNGKYGEILWIFMCDNIWKVSNVSKMNESRGNILLKVPYLKHLQTIDRSFATFTKPLSIRRNIL